MYDMKMLVQIIYMYTRYYSVNFLFFYIYIFVADFVFIDDYGEHDVGSFSDESRPLRSSLSVDPYTVIDMMQNNQLQYNFYEDQMQYQRMRQNFKDQQLKLANFATTRR